MTFCSWARWQPRSSAYRCGFDWGYIHSSNWHEPRSIGPSQLDPFPNGISVDPFPRESNLNRKVTKVTRFSMHSFFFWLFGFWEKKLEKVVTFVTQWWTTTTGGLGGRCSWGDKSRQGVLASGDLGAFAMLFGPISIAAATLISIESDR